MFPMGFWAHRKDNDDGHASVRRAKPEVKAKRAQKNVDKMKSQAMKDKAAAKKGITYGSGIGNETSNETSTDAAAGKKGTAKGTAGKKRKRWLEAKNGTEGGNLVVALRRHSRMYVIQCAGMKSVHTRA